MRLVVAEPVTGVGMYRQTSDLTLAVNQPADYDDKNVPGLDAVPCFGFRTAVLTVPGIAGTSIYDTVLAAPQAPLVFARTAARVPPESLQPGFELASPQHISDPPSCYVPLPDYPGEGWCLNNVCCYKPPSYDKLGRLIPEECRCGRDPCTGDWVPMNEPFGSWRRCSDLAGVPLACCTYTDPSTGKTVRMSMARNLQTPRLCADLGGSYAPIACDAKLQMMQGFGVIGEATLADEFQSPLLAPLLPERYRRKRGCCMMKCVWQRKVPNSQGGHTWVDTQEFFTECGGGNCILAAERKHRGPNWRGRDLGFECQDTVKHCGSDCGPCWYYFTNPARNRLCEAVS